MLSVLSLKGRDYLSSTTRLLEERNIDNAGNFKGGKKRLTVPFVSFEEGGLEIPFPIFIFSRYFLILAHFLSNSSFDDIVLFDWVLYNKFKLARAERQFTLSINWSLLEIKSLRQAAINDMCSAGN